MGLVHRDFKPQNVLVGADGRVKVTDFGLATEAVQGAVEATHDSAGSLHDTPTSSSLRERLTRTGALVGTPAYMAPEQHLGADVGPLADQFAFCVALYEAFCGELPFAGRTFAELSFNVTSGHVREPKAQSMPRWLWPIVARGLAHEPHLRWPDMRALLRASTRDRRRTRRVLGVAGGLLLAGGVAAVAANRQDAPQAICRETTPALLAEDDLARVRDGLMSTKLSYAASSWTRTKSALAHYEEQWKSSWYDACLKHATAQEPNPVFELRQACLEDRRRHVTATVDLLAEADQDVVRNVTRVVARLAPVASCDDVAALQNTAPRLDDPERRAAVDLARAELSRGWLEFAARRFPQAQVRVDKAREHAGQAQHPPIIAEATVLDGHILSGSGKLQEARATLEDGFFLAQHAQIDAVAAGAAVDIAGLLTDTEPENAQRWLRHARVAAIRAGVWDSWRGVRVLSAEGTLLFHLQDFEAAEKVLRQAIAAGEALDPQSDAVAAVYNQLGLMYRDWGRYEQELRAMQRAAEIDRERLGADHPDAAITRANLTLPMIRARQWSQAERELRNVGAVFRQAFGEDHPAVATIDNNLCAFLGDMGRYDEALDACMASFAVRERILDPRDPKLLSSMFNLISVAVEANNTDVVRIYSQRFDQLPQGETLRDETRAVLQATKARVAAFEGDHQAAVSLYSLALETLSAYERPRVDLKLEILAGLGSSLAGLRRTADARRTLEEAVALASGSTDGTASLHSGRAQLALAQLVTAKDPQRGVTLANHARQAFAALGRDSDVAHVDAWLRKFPAAP